MARKVGDTSKSKMIEIGSDSPQAEIKSKMSPEDLSKHSVYISYILGAAEAKKPIEWEWFVRKNFLDGNQWIKYNQSTNSIEQVGVGEKFKTTINKINQITRAVRNYVTKHQPKWEVIAQDLDKKVFAKSITSERFLDLYFLEDLSSGKTFKRKVKEIVGDAMWASCGHIWFWWDTNKKWLMSEWVNPFDYFPDPTAEDTIAYTDAKFVFRAKKSKVEDIVNNDAYMNKEDVVADGKLAASDMYAQLIQMTSGVNMQSFGADKDLSTVIIYEGYVRTKEKNSKGGTINHVVLSATALLLEEATKFNEIPSRTYHTDVEGGRQYTQGWVKNLIPAQKILNAGESNSLEFNHVIARGRYVTDKGSGVNVVVNKSGQIIEKNRGAFFQQLEMQSQPQTVENQINRASSYMEDLGSAHDAFVGRMPSNANSGVAIENLLLGEENNLVDLRDNLDDFLISSGKFILRAFSLYQMSIFTFVDSKNPKVQEPEFFSMVGKSSPVKLDKHTVTNGKKSQTVDIERIAQDNNVRVSIGTWLGTGKMDSKNELMKLYESKVIDLQTVLEYYNAPNIPQIIENVKKEQLDAMAQKNAVAAAPGQSPALDMGIGGGAPGGGGGMPPGLAGAAGGGGTQPPPSPVPAQ